MSRVVSPLVVIFLLYLVVPPSPTSAKNILFFHLIATASHRTSIWPLVERLADQGHNITYIFPIAGNRDGSHKNIEEIAPSKMLPIVRDFVGDFDIGVRLNNTVEEWTWQVFVKSVDLCEAFYDSPDVQQWLSRPGLKYDLIMIDTSLGECGYGLVHRFQAKHILFMPTMANFLWDQFGIVPESSSIPELFFHAKPTEMGFVNRFKTTMAFFMLRLAQLDYMRKIEPIIRTKLNVPDMPSLLEFDKNTSLVFLNSHFIEDYAYAMPPLMVSYSGLWCGKDKRDAGRKPLPQDISTFINQGGDGENQGFIYVSFGSAVMVSGLPENILSNFFNAFAAFPKLKFLWRWTGAVPANTPKNVLLKKWYPQRDILAHSKIKGFITQAGRPSSQEAFCYGVPLISFPIFAEQDTNANRLEYSGVSINFDITNFTAEGLQSGIKELIENPKYTLKMKELSTMFRDRPVDPVDNLLYWIHYVMKYDTSLLRPLGMNQTWWQRRLWDVYAVMFLGIAAVLGMTSVVIYFILKLVVRRVMTTKPKTE